MNLTARGGHPHCSRVGVPLQKKSNMKRSRKVRSTVFLCFITTLVYIKFPAWAKAQPKMSTTTKLSSGNCHSACFFFFLLLLPPFSFFPWTASRAHVSATAMKCATSCSCSPVQDGATQYPFKMWDYFKDTMTARYSGGRVCTSAPTASVAVIKYLQIHVLRPICCDRSPQRVSSPCLSLVFLFFLFFSFFFK